jgi:hypothetical protein
MPSTDVVEVICDLSSRASCHPEEAARPLRDLTSVRSCDVGDGYDNMRMQRGYFLYAPLKGDADLRSLMLALPAFRMTRSFLYAV